MGPWPVARGAYCRSGGQAGKHPKLRCQLAKVAHTATAWVASDSDRDGHAGGPWFPADVPSSSSSESNKQAELPQLSSLPARLAPPPLARACRDRSAVPDLMSLIMHWHPLGKAPSKL